MKFHIFGLNMLICVLMLLDMTHSEELKKCEEQFACDEKYKDDFKRCLEPLKSQKKIKDFFYKTFIGKISDKVFVENILPDVCETEGAARQALNEFVEEMIDGDDRDMLTADELDAYNKFYNCGDKVVFTCEDA